MAEIKGLQVDVSMDTTKFEQGYANIKRSMATFNTVLKTTRNQLKYNEKTQEGFKNHMNNLKGAIENSEKNIEQLGKAYDSLSEKQKQGVKGNQFISQLAKEQDNLRRLRNELHETEMTYASTFTTMGKISQSFKSIGNGLQGVGQKAQDMGRSLTNSITKPALVAGGAMAGITAKLGLDRLVGLDTAKAKLEGLGYSTKEVGNITDQVAKAIEGGMTTMAEGTDVAAGALAAGVKEGKDLQHYIKLVGDAAVGANRPVGDMAMIFNRVQGQGKLMTQELNMIEEGMPGFSNAMAEHLGVSYDTFREMVTNGEVTAKDFLTTMDDFAGGMAGAYSKSWQGMVQNSKAYIGQIGEAFLSSTFQKAKGGLHEFEKMLKSPGAKQWAAETGEKLANVLTSIGNCIKGLINWWQSLDDSTRKVFGGIAKWLAITLVAVGPLLTIFGKLATVTGGMFTTFGQLAGGIGKVAFASQQAGSLLGGLTQVFPRLGVAVGFMTGPVGLIVAGVVALGTAFVIAYKKSETFRNIVNGVLEAIKNGFIVLWNVLKPVLAAIWDIVKTVFQQINDAGNEIIKMLSEQFGPAFKDVGNIVKALQPVFETVMYAIKAVVDFVMPGIKAVFKNTFNGIKNIVTGALDIILGIVKIFVSLFTGNFKLMWSGVKQIFSGFIKVIVGLFQVSFVGQIIAFARSMWTKVKQIFMNFSNGTKAIFYALGAWIGKKWQEIKNSVVNKVKALWAGVKSVWNTLRTGTIKIMVAVAVWLIKKWNSIKNNVVNKVKSLWNGVKNIWNSLLKGTRKIMNSVGGFMSKKWKDIKNGTVNLVTGMKDKVTGVMNKMGDVIKSVTSKIKGFFGDMTKGVEKGLNALIKGVNWVGDKLGMKKLPEVKLHTGTESTHTQRFVTNGKINRDTFATVGDKGRGNGPGGFRHEMIRYPNGKMALTPNRDTTAFLPKGSSVMNGAQTHSMLNNLPKFSTGTNKKKKEWNFAQEALEGANAIKKDVTDKIVSGGKTVVNKSLNMASKGKKWLEDTVGDVMDWIEKPGKLLDKVLESVGLDLSGFGIPESASLPYDMMKGMFKKLKKAAIDTIKGWMEEQEGGDGDAAWLLKHPVLQRFGHYTGGLMFNGGRHYGIDFGMPTGTKIRALTDGTITQSGWATGGGGNQITLKEPGGKYFQWYMHMSKLLAKKGDKVKTGDVIGLSGSTGNSTTPHLHIQRMKGRVGNDTALSNVMDWLKGLGSGSQNKSASKWKGDIKRAAKKMKVNLSGGDVNDIVRLIQTESGGNAGVTQQIQDVNSGGNEAQGLLQFTPGTFNGYKLKGHGNIKNGYHQLLAFFNNSNWRGNLSAWKRRMASGLTGWGPTGSRRFASGGLINTEGWYNLAEGGYPEIVVPTDPAKASDAMKLIAIASERVSQRAKNNKRPNQLRMPSTSNTNDNEMINFMARQLEATQRQVELLTQLVASNQRLEQKPTGFTERDVSQAQGKRARMMAYNMGGAF
ncbi:peptidoglycan DD-metalloendopeptidase family protein [Staphylococcus simulans]|uniref:peptidoglycan DD-metalloendopeptidase family protein n=1 Tax=Staphylococcus simulans TaxID=1286 RepID=UPI000CD2E373|nr:peptidoglycan DD-metalloendopeptidase family protein [Staphylococcus simulans]PNZ40492.1 phage tail tape measure protein [Staphylococcus simulans]SQE74635.1 bacteriophage tail tape measure protein, TP901 family [Staphylococcus simulans]